MIDRRKEVLKEKKAVHHTGIVVGDTIHGNQTQRAIEMLKENSCCLIIELRL